MTLLLPEYPCGIKNTSQMHGGSFPAFSACLVWRALFFASRQERKTGGARRAEGFAAEEKASGSQAAGGFRRSAGIFPAPVRGKNNAGRCGKDLRGGNPFMP